MITKTIMTYSNDDEQVSKRRKGRKAKQTNSKTQQDKTLKNLVDVVCFGWLRGGCTKLSSYSFLSQKFEGIFQKFLR